MKEVTVDIDYKTAEKLGWTPKGLGRAIVRLQRWMRANPGNPKPPRHIQEVASLLRPRNAKQD